MQETLLIKMSQSTSILVSIAAASNWNLISAERHGHIRFTLALTPSLFSYIFHRIKLHQRAGPPVYNTDCVDFCTRFYTIGLSRNTYKCAVHMTRVRVIFLSSLLLIVNSNAETQVLVPTVYTSL